MARSLAGLAVALLAVGCIHPPPITDPHAGGVNNTQWQVTVRGTPSAAFDAAMHVVSDSAYRIADARKDAGIIKTDYRKESEVQHGGQQLKTMLAGSDRPVRRQILVLAKGVDSSTVTITGEELLENIGKTVQVAAYADEWRFVRGVGEAMLAQLH